MMVVTQPKKYLISIWIHQFFITKKHLCHHYHHRIIFTVVIGPSGEQEIRNSMKQIPGFREPKKPNKSKRNIFLFLSLVNSLVIQVFFTQVPSDYSGNGIQNNGRLGSSVPRWRCRRRQFHLRTYYYYHPYYPCLVANVRTMWDDEMLLGFSLLLLLLLLVYTTLRFWLFIVFSSSIFSLLLSGRRISSHYNLSPWDEFRVGMVTKNANYRQTMKSSQRRNFFPRKILITSV